MENQITLSPTRIRTWVRCKRSYHWRYNRHLIRFRKTVPLSLGIVTGQALAYYYSLPPEKRSHEALGRCFNRSVRKHHEEFFSNVAERYKAEAIADWKKVTSVSKGLLEKYHSWAQPRDEEFSVVSVEKSYTIALTPEIHLLAIPDAVVMENETSLVFEHKVRHRFRKGDFGIDYQSVGSCLVSGSIGTIYNILEYAKTLFHREVIVRSDYELDYFREMLIHIGKDILSTSPEDMYPMPMKRCACDYWDLCNGEIRGLDMDDIIRELYVESVRRPPQEESTDSPEEG